MRRISRTSKATAATAFGTALFGMSPVLLVVAAVPGIVGGIYRLGVPLVLYSLFAMSHGGLIVPRRELAFALVAGLAFALNIGLFYTAITIVGPSLPSFLSTTSVLWVGLYWIVVAKQKLSGTFWTGTLLCFAGTAGLLSPIATGSMSAWGIVISLGAGAAYAAFVIIGGIGCRQMKLAQFLLYSHLAGTAALVAFALISGASVIVYSGRSLAALVAIGIFSQAIGIGAVTLGQRELSAPRVSAILVSEPLFTLAFASLVLGLTIGSTQLVSCLVLLSGAALASHAAASAPKLNEIDAA